MVDLPSGVDRRRRERLVSRPCAAAGPNAGAGGEAAAVARYLADMTAQLESMAAVARLDLLAYFLAMARAEAVEQARASPDDACVL